jgi:hypothetical protein
MERVSTANEYANARGIERGDVRKSLFLREEFSDVSITAAQQKKSFLDDDGQHSEERSPGREILDENECCAED